MNFREQLSEIKETISYIMVFAPDKFPNEHVSLDSIFAELRSLFALIKNHRRIVNISDKCHIGIENSYSSYKADDLTAGFLQIQDVLHLLLAIK